jgi:GT2 family glycosyltransferase
LVSLETKTLRPVMLVHILVLNYNGRQLLAECLPSILAAADGSRHECVVAVVDNDSSDGSTAWLRHTFPQIELHCCRNEGLASLNRVLPLLSGAVALLLNNDIKFSLDRADVVPTTVNPIDALVEPLRHPPRSRQRCFMSAPRCYQCDGTTLEGFKTSVEWSHGLVRATGRFDGADKCALTADWTASAGAAMAVDREVFVGLGGFDPLFFPGRIEDLDFAYRAYLAGHHAVYVPEAVVYHQGAATFAHEFGTSGNEQLALRNTLLFQWKNLRHPRHLARMAVGWSLRLAADIARAPLARRGTRLHFAKACWQAIRCWRRRRTTMVARTNLTAERAFFSRFHPRAMRRRGMWYRAGEQLESTVRNTACPIETSRPPRVEVART